jgi:hypothetical protein
MARYVLRVARHLQSRIVPFAVFGELPGERWLSATDDNALVFGATGTTLLPCHRLATKIAVWILIPVLAWLVWQRHAPKSGV